MTADSRTRWAPWILGLAVLAVGFAVWRPFPPGIWHDDGVYVLLGRSLAEGHGLRYLGVPGTPPAPKFPPLYPALLAMVWLVFPSFPGNVAVLSGVNVVLLALAAGAFAAWVRNALGASLRLALGVTALAWLSPALWRVTLVPLSEPLFLLALVWTLRAGALMERRPGAGPILIFLVAALSATYVRTLGLGLLVAGVVSLVIRRRGGAALGVAAGGAVLLLPWFLWTRHAAAALPPPLRDTLGPYGSWWIHQVVQDPTAFGTFLVGAAPQLVGRVLSLLLPAVTGPLLWAGLLLLPFLALGMVDAGRRTPFMPLALLVSLAILLAWPFQDIRLLTPFAPLLVLATVLGFRRAGEWSGRGEAPAVARGRTVASAAPALLAGAWLVVLVPVSIARLANGWVDRPYRIRSEALVAAARAVSTRTPSDAVIGAPELWPGIHLLTGRRVVPSAPFHPLDRERPVWGTPGEQHELWIRTGVTHVLLEDGGRVHGEAMDRIAALCPPGSIRVLERPPDPFLVALEWDAACRARLLDVVPNVSSLSRSSNTGGELPWPSPST